MDTADKKKQLRRQALARRDSLSFGERKVYSETIIDKLTNLPCYLQAEVVLIYISFRSEVDTAPLLERAFADGKAVFAPKVLGREMAFFQISGTEDLTEGYHGIWEPEEGMTYTDWVSQQCEPENFSTLICLPGAAFDRGRHRIGYGGGFYDRYLKRLSENQKGTVRQTATAALAFSCQVFEEIPWEPHDICPEKIITETEIISKHQIS